METSENARTKQLLADVARHYEQPIPVWVGKVVTLADFEDVSDAGLPHAVIEIDGDCMIGPGGKRAYASIRSVRIASITRSEMIVRQWVDPGMLREYVFESEKA